MTTCAECGGPVKTRREKHYRYAECGLPNVIVDGIAVSECQRCGETYTGIPAIEGLHRAIAAAVIYKKGRLAPEDIKVGCRLRQAHGDDPRNGFSLGEPQGPDGIHGRSAASSPGREGDPGHRIPR